MQQINSATLQGKPMMHNDTITAETFKAQIECGPKETALGKLLNAQHGAGRPTRPGWKGLPPEGQIQFAR